MKLVDLNCPGCGALLKVNPELTKGICNYCGNEFLIDDEIQKLNITNGVQLGYQQEQGRIDAVNRKRDELLNSLSSAIEPARKIDDAYRKYQEKEYKYNCYKTGTNGGIIVLTILLHIFVVPIVCLIIAFIIGGIYDSGSAFGNAFLILWILSIVFTILIFVMSKKKKMDTKQNLAYQRDNAYDKYQERLKKYYNKLTFLPPDYRYLDAIESFYRYVNNSRANDIQQAMNLYEEEMHRLRMENSQAAMLREQQRQSSIQVAQLATQIGILARR